MPIQIGHICWREVQECFINIAREIAKRELLLIVTPEPEEVKKQIAATVNMNNVRFLECDHKRYMGTTTEPLQ